MRSTDQGQGERGRRYNALPSFSSFAGKALRRKVCHSWSGLPKWDRHLFGIRAKMEKVSYQTRNRPYRNPAAEKRAGSLPGSQHIMECRRKDGNAVERPACEAYHNGIAGGSTCRSIPQTSHITTPRKTKHLHEVKQGKQRTRKAKT